MNYITGIDIGTTHIKSIIFDMHGKAAAEAICPSPVITASDGVCAFEPEQLWACVCGLLRECTDSLIASCGKSAVGNICGISAAGMAETGVLLDGGGNPLYPAVLWNDPCTVGMEKWWEQTFGTDKLINITGQKAQHNYSVNRLIWMERKRPGLLKKASLWLCMPDYIEYKLCGGAVMDYSIACRTMMFDVSAKKWSEEICRHAGIDPRILPCAAPSSSFIGRVTREASALTGIPEGVGVYAGGHDHICGAFASGISQNGDILDSSGTAEQFLTVSELESTASLRALGFNAGCYVAGERHYITGAVPASGKTVDWFINSMNANPDTLGEGMESDGVMFFPFLEGGSSPERDASFSAAFAGLRGRHNVKNMMQAVYEGLCFELKKGISDICAEPQRIIVTGGGTLNPSWLQTKANVLGHSLIIPDAYQATALGAALLAGIGSGLHADAESAVKQTFKVKKIVEPDKDREYDKAYEIYIKLRESVLLKSLQHQ